MNTAFCRIGLLVGALSLILTSGTAPGQDWPQWRGVNRDGKANGFVAPQSWPKTLKQKWKVTVGLGDSTPAVVGDKVYVFAMQGDDEVLSCLDAATGKSLWDEKYPPHTTISGAPSRHGQGPRSSPTVADGKVVTLGFSGILSCLDAATGKVVWRKKFDKEFKKTTPQFYVATSPIIVDGMCMAHVGGPGNGALMAFDLSSGDTKWEWAGEGPAYASPVLMAIEGQKTIVEETEKSLVGVDVATGKLLWKAPFAGRGMAYNAATPIVDGSTIICTGHGTSAFTIEKTGDGLAAKQLWNNADLGTQFNTPVLKDGKLYGLSAKQNFFCMDAATGKVLWTDTAKHGQFGAIVDAGSVMMALTPDGQLVVFRPNDKQMEDIVSYKVAEGGAYAHPIVVGNRIYIKDKDSLALLSVEGQVAS